MVKTGLTETLQTRVHFINGLMAMKNLKVAREIIPMQSLSWKMVQLKKFFHQI